MNTYCWIHSTYTIPSAFWKRIGFDVAHPGVDKTQDPLERRYHKYYQWVCFCLFFQVCNITIYNIRLQISLVISGMNLLPCPLGVYRLQQYSHSRSLYTHIKHNKVQIVVGWPGISPSNFFKLFCLL